MAYEQEHPLIQGTSNDTTAATPDRLGSGWLTASLASSADVDYFKIDTTSAALIKIDLSNLLVTDTKHWSLALLDGNGDYLRSLTSTVSGAPLVDGASNTGTSLKVTGLTADVPVGSRFSFVTSAADSTIYTVSSATPSSSGFSTLTLTTALPSSLAASTALAFDPAQTLAGGATTSFTGQVSAAGTYFVKVVANSWTQADYNIRATVLKTIESTGANGSKDDAIASATSDQNRPVENAYMTGALSAADDHDFWVFSTATMTGSLTLDFSAASGSDNSPEWDIKLTQWTGDQPLTSVQGTAISGTAGASKPFTIDFAKYTTATTFVVDVSKAAGVTVDTGAYKLRLSGATLDLNDSPLVTIDGVTSSQPYDQINTGVTRSVKAGANSTDSKVALSTLFTATDADAGQTVANYKVALSKASGETANLGASIQLIESNGTTSTTFALGSTASLTAAQMAKAYVVPGSVTGDLSLALQAFDSSGALDNSGASSVMVQTLRVVSSSVGVTATNDGTLALEEGRASSTEVLGFILGAAPTADVKVYLEQDASKTPFVFDSSFLTFSASNFNIQQKVTVSARNNQTTEGAHTGQISFRVVSTDSQYNGYSLTGLVVAISDPANSLPTGVPTLGGTPTEDQTLSAVTSGIADLDVLGTFNYNWQRSPDGASWTDIGLASKANYVLGDADAGKKVRLEISYVDGQGTKETVYSAATTIANVNDAPTGSVTISGTASAGQTLTASNTLADADGMGTVSYQWRADDANIANATGSTLVLGATHVGKSITVAASYTDNFSTAESNTSSATTAVFHVNRAPTGSVTISGTPTQGQTLTATNTLADVDGIPASGVAGALSYQWKAGDVSITGATSSTYVLTQAEVGKAVTVTASYTDAGGTAESQTSSATTAVISIDTLAPTVATFSPADGATGVGVASNIILTFSEAVVARSGGTIELMTDYGSGHQSVEVFSVSDATRVTISGNVVTIDPTSALLPSTGYHLGFNSALADSAGNAFSYTHGQYNFTTAAANTAGKTADITAYSWKAHTLLTGVSLTAGTQTGISDSNGTASFTAVTDASLTLTASRAIPSAEATATSAAVNLQDAIAILKMIVGLEVNGTGKALSPYQALAADYDGNGLVQLTDAIGVLKHVVGLPTSTPTWRFVNELDTTVPSKTTLSPGVAGTSITASLSASSPVKVGLVGYLTGDVDGSYAGATGALDLDITQANYFTELVTANSGLSLAQFGVYPVA